MLLKKLDRVDPKYLSDKYRRTLEDHLPLLRKSAVPNPIGSGIGLKYRDNYYGLLNYLNVRPKYHHAVLRINELTNPQNTGVVGVVYIPKYSEIDKLVTILEQKNNAGF